MDRDLYVIVFDLKGTMIEAIQREPLGQIEGSAQRTLAAMVDLSNSTRERSSTSNDIARHVEQIATATDENSHIAERTSEAAQRLGDLASGLEQSVGRFRI